MENYQSKEESKIVNPYLTQEAKTVNPKHKGYIVFYVENAPQMDMAFKGSIRIIYDGKSKELIILVQDE